MFKVSALYTNTGTETLFPCSDSSSKMFCFEPSQTSPVTSWIH